MQVNVPGSMLATYFYDAAGNKLRNVSNAGGTWDYEDGIVYKNGQVQFIQTEEGRVTLAADSINYHYIIELKDYLGNVRASYSAGATANLIQENDYFPFGLTTNYYDLNSKNRYLYNGKELQTDLTEQYDYGARFYDPVIGRWDVIDPYAEKYSNAASYAYVLNNPIKSIDINGDTLHTSGSASATAAFKQINDDGMGNIANVTQDKNGNWALSSLTDDQVLSMTVSQSEVYKNLNTIISDQNTSNFNIVDGNDQISKSIAFGDNGTAKDANGNSVSATPGVHTIDVGDIKNLGTTGLETAQGMLGHELDEGYQIQVKGMNPGLAHKDALKTEGAINDTRRLQRGPELDGSKVTMQVYDGTNVRTVKIQLNGVNDWNFKSSDVQGNHQ